MRHYLPLEIKSGETGVGRWHYCCSHNGSAYPVGLCAKDCPGHATAQEAREHYRQGLLQDLRFEPITQAWPKFKCDVAGCGAEATRSCLVRDEIGGHRLRICEAHATAEACAPLVTVGDAWAS